MSDQSGTGTPPPLLLMSNEGLNLGGGTGLFMPTPASQQPASPELEAEAESFIGQSSVSAAAGIQSHHPVSVASTPPKMLPSTQQPLPPTGSKPPGWNDPPPVSGTLSGASSNKFRGYRHPAHPATAGPINIAPPAPLPASLFTTQAPATEQTAFTPQAQVQPEQTPSTHAPAAQNLFQPAPKPFSPSPQQATTAVGVGSLATDQPITMQPPPPPTQSYIDPSQHVSFQFNQGDNRSVSDETYHPIKHHWFYCRRIEGRSVWKPFSHYDSSNLDAVFKTLAPDSQRDSFGHSPSPSPVAEGPIIHTDGGRFDVNLAQRTRSSVYWDEEEPSEVRRCSWFFRKEPDIEHRFTPYTEDFADKLEKEYEQVSRSGSWHKRIEFPGGEVIIMHSPSILVHYVAPTIPNQWESLQADNRPRVVKRGIPDADSIEAGEMEQIDHLLFVLHGIGPAVGDIRFRTIVECVDSFRENSYQLIKSHFASDHQQKRIGRIEFLPVHWHKPLHGDATGIDRNMQRITLRSISKLRHFTNDILLDVLLYSSPIYCQTIADTVGNELNRLHKVFIERNPGFTGQVSVIGHSLGSLVLFDLLCHQSTEDSKTADHRQKELAIDSPEIPPNVEPNTIVSSMIAEDNRSTSSSQMSSDTLAEDEDLPATVEEVLRKLNLTDFQTAFDREQIDLDSLKMCDDSDIKDLGLPLGPRKKIKAYLSKIQRREEITKQRELQQAAEAEKRKMDEQHAAELEQQTVARETLFSPQASSLSVTIVKDNTGIGQISLDYPQLNFHVANFFLFGSPTPMFLIVRGISQLNTDFHLPTCGGFFNIFHPFDPVAYRFEPLVMGDTAIRPAVIPHHKGRKRLHYEIKESLGRMGADIKRKVMEMMESTWKSVYDFAMAHGNQPQAAIEGQKLEKAASEVTEQALASAAAQSDQMSEQASTVEDPDSVYMGELNQGRRLDYMLQESPVESFNDYLFALGSHGCYWESEDTVLLVLKETYSLIGIQPVMPGKAKQVTQSPPIAPPPLSGFQPSQSDHGHSHSHEGHDGHCHDSASKRGHDLKIDDTVSPYPGVSFYNPVTGKTILPASDFPTLQTDPVPIKPFQPASSDPVQAGTDSKGPVESLETRAGHTLFNVEQAAVLQPVSAPAPFDPFSSSIPTMLPSSAQASSAPGPFDNILSTVPTALSSNTQAPSALLFNPPPSSTVSHGGLNQQQQPLVTPEMYPNGSGLVTSDTVAPPPMMGFVPRTTNK